MDNKELPQEIVSEIRQYAIKQCGGDYEGGMKGIQKDLLIGAYTTGAELAQTYYNSIIEGEEKEIERLNYIVNLFRLANELPTKQHGTTQDDLIIANQKAELKEKQEIISVLKKETSKLQFEKQTSYDKGFSDGRADAIKNPF